MSRYVCWLILFSLILSGCAKQTSVPEEKAPVLSWQEQYDLGIRYLSEGNYEEAIIAFTAAIEIDPKQAPAYVGRGDAYVQSGETEENLTAAQVDYEKAIELDELLVEAYLGLADVYIRKEAYDMALEILQQGFEKVSDDKIEEKICEVLTATDDFVIGNIIKFTPFSELNSSTQFLIEDLMDKAITDPDEAVRLLSTDYIDLIDQGIAPKELRTMKNNYKIEMRPIEGTAYYCAGAYCDGRLRVNHGWGTCANWNWNGSFEMTITDSSGGTHNHSGNCKDGLLDGAIYKPISLYNLLTQTYNPYYEYYDLGKPTGKIVYEDGREGYRNNSYGENDVFYYSGRADIGWYEYWILW